MVQIDEAEARTERRQAVHSWIIVIGVLLSLAFIVLLLVIVNSPTDIQNMASEANRPLWFWFSRRSYFVYETVLSGMLGAYLGEIFQIGGLKTEIELRAYGQRFIAALFLGGAAAVVVGVLFPLVVLGEFEGRGINSWTLVAAAGIAGNRARDAFSQVESVIARLLADFEPNIDSAAISRSVKAGVQEAFAVPPPVKYQGLAAADVFRSNESVITSKSDQKFAELMRGSEFELKVYFAADSGTLGTTFEGWSKSIAIREGDSHAMVPFRLQIDFGFIALPLAERDILVAAQGTLSVETFKFTVPLLETPTSPADKVSTPKATSAKSASRYINTPAISTQ